MTDDKFSMTNFQSLKPFSRQTSAKKVKYTFRQIVPPGGLKFGQYFGRFYGSVDCPTLKIMSISLPPELQAYIESRALAGVYASPDDVVGEAVRRMMAEEERHEAAVVEGLRGEQSPLTQGDMDQVRKLARRGRVLGAFKPIA